MVEVFTVYIYAYFPRRIVTSTPHTRFLLVGDDKAAMATAEALCAEEVGDGVEVAILYYSPSVAT